MTRHVLDVRSIPDRAGCDVLRKNLYYAIDRISKSDLNEVRSLLGARDPEAGAELRRAVQRLRNIFNDVRKSCAGRNDRCCAVLNRTVRDVYDEADYLNSLVERQAGEERMRAGMFGDLGRYPSCRRGLRGRNVWVRSRVRTSKVK